MKKLPVLIIILSLVLHIEVYSQSSTPLYFVKGLKTPVLYGIGGAEGQYMYRSAKTFKVVFQYEAFDLMFYTYDDKNEKIWLDFKFEVGMTDEYPGIKNKSRFQIGQFDFDNDKIDEMVIGIQDNEEANNGISINIFKLINGKWSRLAVLTGLDIMGVPIAEIKANKITIQRHLHGWYYEWTYTNGKFTQTRDGYGE